MVGRTYDREENERKKRRGKKVDARVLLSFQLSEKKRREKTK